MIVIETTTEIGAEIVSGTVNGTVIENVSRTGRGVRLFPLDFFSRTHVRSSSISRSKRYRRCVTGAGGRPLGEGDQHEVYSLDKHSRTQCEYVRLSRCQVVPLLRRRTLSISTTNSASTQNVCVHFCHKPNEQRITRKAEGKHNQSSEQSRKVLVQVFVPTIYVQSAHASTVRCIVYRGKKTKMKDYTECRRAVPLDFSEPSDSIPPSLPIRNRRTVRFHSY